MKELLTNLCKKTRLVQGLAICMALMCSSSIYAAFDSSINLITENPDFENGGSGWYTGGGTIDDTEAYSGSYSAKQETAGDGRDWRSRSYETIVPGQMYQLSFYYKTAEGSTGNPQCRFRFFKYGVPNDDFKGEAQRTLELTEGEWVKVIIEYTCPDESEYFDLFFSANTFGTFSGSVWYDDLTVNPQVDDNAVTNPEPDSGSIDIPVDITLEWDMPFTKPDGYSLYLVEGAEPNWVEIDTPTLVISDPNVTTYTPAEDLKPGVTYSWRVDTSVKGEVWTFTTIPPTAYAPDPANEETAVSPLRSCSWGDVPGAVSYDIYWGTDEELVTAGDSSVLLGTQAGTTFSPEMDFETVYYWRIDTNLADSVSAGDVWMYTTDGRICDPVMAGDVNNDCVVDIADFAIMASDWLNCTLSNGICQ